MKNRDVLFFYNDFSYFFSIDFSIVEHCMLTSFFTLIAAKDESSDTKKALEFQSMLRCYEPSTYPGLNDFSPLLENTLRSADACAFTGVTCTDGHV